MTRPPIDWDAYLARFHAQHPGITEAVLARSSRRGQTPYEWLGAGIDPAARVLDLGCGSGPARPDGAERWAGLDRSVDELARAAGLGRGPLVHGDITALPIADASIDVATSSMALMLVHPLDAALREIGRVVRPSGELRLLVPTPGPTPLTARDAATYLRLFWAARSTTAFPPTDLRSGAVAALVAHGFEVTADERARFVHRVETTDDAERFVDSWYLPSVSEARLAAARRRAAAMAPFEVGIPLRRIVARRT